MSEGLFSGFSFGKKKGKPRGHDETTMAIPTTIRDIQVKGSPVQFREGLNYNNELLNHLVRMDNQISSGVMRPWDEPDDQDWLEFNIEWLMGKAECYADLFPEYRDMVRDADNGEDIVSELLKKHKALYWLFKAMNILLTQRSVPRSWNADQRKIWVDMIGKEDEDVDSKGKDDHPSDSG